MDNETNIKIPHNAPASRESVVAAVNQLRRITELRQKGSVSITNGETIELKAAERALSEFFLNHANEFLSVWFAVVDEYEPMINFFVRLSRRVTSINTKPQ